MVYYGDEQRVCTCGRQVWPLAVCDDCLELERDCECPCEDCDQPLNRCTCLPLSGSDAGARRRADAWVVYRCPREECGYEWAEKGGSSDCPQCQITTGVNTGRRLSPVPS